MQLNEQKEDKKVHVESVDISYVSPLYKSTLQYVTTREEIDLDAMNKLDICEKEQQIIEDLLSILIGYDGEIIFIEDKKDFRMSYEEVKFDLNIDLPQAQLEIVYRILPAAKYFHIIQNYCELFSRYQFGLINHSLIHSIQLLMKEYHILICQLENQFRNNNLNLQKFWFYFHPTLKTLLLIKEFIMFFFNNNVDIWHNLFETEIPDTVKGAFTLDGLIYHTTRFEGDSEANQLYKYLFCHASLPYLNILFNWIYKGIIIDNYNEFFIKENDVKQKQDLEVVWNNKFSINKHKVPTFLLKYIEFIFIAGKLINVIKLCNNMFDPLVPLLDLDNIKDNELDIQSYIKDIERAYLHSNQEFIKMIFKDQSLIKQLRCFKRYFFLEQSDFFTHFLDLASEDLLKPARLVSTTKIQSLFDLSLSNPASVTYLDPFKDKLEIMFTQFKVSDIINQLDFNNNIREDNFEFNSDYQLLNEEYDLPLPMTGIESFTIQSKVEFPLCLIFSNKDHLKYQVMFRNLMLLKHVEQLLETTFIESTKTRRNMAHKINELKNHHLQIHTLQNRMLNLIQNLIYFICIQVIEPNFIEFENELIKCTTLKEIVQLHSNFLNKCFEQSTLINDKLYGIINKILRSSLRFIHFIKKVNFIDQQNNNNDLQPLDINKYLNHFEYNFLYHIKMLINGLNHFSNNNEEYLSLALIIDFNSFYSNLNLQEKPPSISSGSIPNSPLFTEDGFF